MAVMGMTATGMATVMRTGIIIIGTTAIDTVTVVIGAVVGTDMEWAPAGDGRRVATFGFATDHTKIRRGASASVGVPKLGPTSTTLKPGVPGIAGLLFFVRSNPYRFPY